jgi:hypothetical protein
MEANQVVENSSEQVAGSPAASTGTSGGSAGNNTTGSVAGAVPTPTPVVAPKGFRSELQLMLQGWQELIPSDSVLTSSGNSLSEAGVVAQLQGYLGAYTALDASATADKEARDQVASQLAEARKYYALLKTAVANHFGVGSPQLVKFGLKAKKPHAPLSAQKLAVKVAKAKATRALRGTKGPVEKLDTASGPMAFVAPVATTVPVAGSAPAEPVVSAASPPAGK